MTMVRDSKNRFDGNYLIRGKKHPQHHQGKEEEAGNPHQVAQGGQHPDGDVLGLEEAKADAGAQKEDGQKVADKIPMGRPGEQRTRHHPGGNG